MTEEKIKFGGATSWPRMKVRPHSLPISEIAFDLLHTYTRPIFHLIFCMHLFTPQWLNVVSYCLNDLQMSEQLFFAVTTVMTHHLTYCIVNGFFALLDQFNWLPQYKLYTPKASHASRSLKMEAFLSSAASTVPMGLAAYFFAYPAFVYFGMPAPAAPLASNFELWKLFVATKMGGLLAFDVVHRIIHSKYFYASIHAKHHRFISTVSIAAEFAHPIEGLGSIGVPLMCGLHPYMWCAWLAWEQTNAAMTHR